MILKDHGLRESLIVWRRATDDWGRATADNLWFEERVSPMRQQVFEETARGAEDPVALRRRQADYYRDFVTVDEEIPHTFLKALAPVDLSPLHETQKIMRLESLTRPLDKAALTFDQLRAAFAAPDQADVVERFLGQWNDSTMRDWRPAFAAFEDELRDTLAEEEWPDRMRDRLGLAHYDCVAGPVPVALMKYSVEEVMLVAAVQQGTCAITAPTVLDTGPWPYFFPAPRELSCGRTMPLIAVADEKELLAEILHFRITYRREHIERLGEIRRPPELFELKTLRNHHLVAVQIASGRDSFGEEIP